MSQNNFKKLAIFILGSIFILSAFVITPFSFVPGVDAEEQGDAPEMVNICHKTDSEQNPWNAIQISESALDEHLGHGDFMYEGPIKDNGHPDNKDGQADQWCADNAPEEPVGEDAEITIIAHKVVCEAEEYLPNWGAGGADITETTAEDYVASNEGKCWLESGWEFEWALPGTENPGDDLYGPAGSPWTTFGPTDGSGMTTLTLDSEDLDDAEFVWMREVLQEGYIPFTFGENENTNVDDFSAELYCNIDVLNYDNYDRVDGIQGGESYNCVAFNTQIEQPVDMCPDMDGIQESEEECLEELMCDFDGEGWYGEYFNYSKEHEDMNLPSNLWPDLTHGDPLSSLVSWTADWYEDLYFKFAQVDSSLTFGENFFPFDGTLYEDKEGDTHDYHFGVHWSAKTTVTEETEYDFTLTSDDDAWVYLDGELVGDNSGIHPPTTENFSETLGVGEHIFDVFFAERHIVRSHMNLISSPELTFIPFNNECPVPPVQCEDEISSQTLVSDETTTQGGEPAVPVEAPFHSAWTASIPGATWIWGEHPVSDPVNDLTETFIKTFTISGTPTGGTLDIATDNSYSVVLNGEELCEDPTEKNFTAEGQDVCVIPAEMLNSGSNTIEFTVKNWAQSGGTQATNPAGLLYKITLEENACIPEPEPEPEDPGTITVCKIIVDEDGNVVDGSEMPGVNFSVASFTPNPETSQGAPVGEFGEALFTSPLSFNSVFFGENDNNAQCITFGNLPLGGYYWGEEAIVPDTDWETPKYNDQFQTTVNSLDDFFPYSGELFDGDSDNDEERNKEADGHIILTQNKPARTLVVLNKMSQAPVEPSINLVATKIICNDESLLPNWGAGGADITASTATTFLADKGDNCWLEEGWDFQWAPNGTVNPGDNNGEEGSPWTTFGSTDSNGVASTLISLANANPLIWVREVPQEGYVAFSGVGGSNVSSELYCNTDVLNYDNYDWINNLEDGETYYCVGFNALVAQEEEEEEEEEEPEQPLQNNGGGGGGNGGFFQTNIGGEVLGEDTESMCGLYLLEYIKYGAENNPAEVTKLQKFLNQYMGANLSITGIYDLITVDWVNQFQLRYGEEILRPWMQVGLHDNIDDPTGYVYKTTQHWINHLVCPELNLPNPDLSEEGQLALALETSGNVLGEELANEEQNNEEDLSESVVNSEININNENGQTQEEGGGNSGAAIAIVIAALVVVGLLAIVLRK